MAASAGPNYNFLGQVTPFWPLKVNTADVIYPGDMLYWDSGTKTHRPLVDPTIGNLFSGLALGQYPPAGNLDNAANLAVPSITPTVSAAQHGQFTPFATAGETYDAGDALYIGADSQTVTKAAPGGTDAADIIGYYFPMDGGSSQGPVAAGDTIPAVMRINWPSPDLA